ncbi:MATE family efflux transporter, partial [Staphylococcus aureus]|nr:MATE family efflux transporter [Staphylococcus aureus]
VSYWLGAQRPLLAAQMARQGLQLTAALGLCLALSVWLAGDAILGFYTRDAAVTALAAGLLIWVALYHLADSVQCYCIFVLRSFRITL